MLANWIDNLNERGRMVLFGVVVLALAVLCGWVLFSGPDDTSPEAPAPVDETTVVPTTPTTETSDDTGTGAGEEPATPTGLIIDADPPVSEEQMARLARQAADFTVVYQSFRYDENVEAKITRVRSMLSNDSQVNPGMSIPDGPMMATLRADKAVVQITPRHVEVTVIAPEVVAFAVTAESASTSAGTTTRTETTYNVTLYRDQGSWGVGSFDLGSHEHE